MKFRMKITGREYSIVVIFFLAAAFAVASTSISKAASQERVYVQLNDGNVISGEILKTKQDSVILDNAASVMTIPRNRIREISRTPARANDPKPASAASDSQASLPASRSFPESKIFCMRNSSPASIESHVEMFEDGVVQVKTPGGLGSGFIISDEGHVLTNCHVIENETQITITIFEKTKSDFNQIKFNNIKIVALNPFYDLALLKIEDKNEKPFTKCFFAKSTSWRKGEAVFAIGNPYGLNRSISQGIISDRDRYINGLIYIQTTAPINMGNSGGPLFDMKGDVIGVINMAFFRSDGIGFGIPLNYIFDFLSNVEAYSFDKDNPNSGHLYNRPPRRASFEKVTTGGWNR